MNRFAFVGSTGNKINLAVLIDVAMYALVATSAVRYLSSHGVSNGWWLVCTLSIALAAAYLTTRWLPEPVEWAGPLLVITLWIALVWIAPSFWWCAFSLFFVCRRRLSTVPAMLSLAIITAVTGGALIYLARGFDWTIVVGVVVVAILLNASYGQVERSNARLETAMADLIEAQQRLAEAERRSGQLAERQRISHELHDTVTQGLTSSLLMMEASLHAWSSSPSEARNSLLIATDSVRTSLAETRNMVHQLASPRLDGISLSEALTRLVEELPGGSCLTEGEPYDLGADITHGILRISQSAVENVRRHAAASRVRLTVTYLPGQVNLDILDNGVGFEPAEVALPSVIGGYGLRAMRQRVEALGGSFSVESSPTEGTVVAAQFPTGATLTSRKETFS